MTLLFAVERAMRKYHIPASRFGREATHDPRLVFDLRNGRQPRQETESRVLEFIAARASSNTQVPS